MIIAISFGLSHSMRMRLTQPNEFWLLPFAPISYINVGSSPQWELGYVYQVIGIIYITTLVFAVDVLVPSIMAQIKAQLLILAKSIRWVLWKIDTVMCNWLAISGTCRSGPWKSQNYLWFFVCLTGVWKLVGKPLLDLDLFEALLKSAFGWRCLLIWQRSEETLLGERLLGERLLGGDVLGLDRRIFWFGGRSNIYKKIERWKIDRKIGYSPIVFGSWQKRVLESCSTFHSWLSFEGKVSHFTIQAILEHDDFQHYNNMPINFCHLLNTFQLQI